MIRGLNAHCSRVQDIMRRLSSKKDSPEKGSNCSGNNVKVGEQSPTEPAEKRIKLMVNIFNDLVTWNLLILNVFTD